MKASEVLADAVRTLKASPAIDHWQKDREEIEADDLLCHVLDVDDVDPDEDVPAAARSRFERMVVRRATGEPFSSSRVRGVPGSEIGPAGSVPRDSTEFLAEQAVRRLRGRRRPIAVDLATGGGTVALAIANEVRGVRVFGTDIAKDAIRVARRNAELLRLRGTFLVGDLFGALPKRLAGKVDVITLHPPYVARGELRELPEEIRRFEPLHTLSDRSLDGLGLVGRAAAEGGTWLRRGGWLLIEVSPDRARAVAGYLRAVRRVRARWTTASRSPVCSSRGGWDERRSRLAFRHVALADHGRTGHPRRRVPGRGLPGRRRDDVAGVSPPGAGPVRHRPSGPVGRPGRRHAAGLVGAHPRARVRGRLVRGARWRRVLRQRRRSAALSAGAGG
jgi:release factor glutamine methyltransferase